MGEAKRRGTFDKRVAEAKERAAAEQAKMAASMPEPRRRGVRRHLELAALLAVATAPWQR